MKSPTAIDQQSFKRALSRNIKLPLAAGLAGAVVFVALILYLLSVIGWVEHTDQVTRSAAEAQRLSVDLESGMRGFLISGDPRFLEPYEAAQSRIGAELSALRILVADNQPQVARVDRITATQKSWSEYAAQLIAMRRAGEDYRANVNAGRGKALSDAMRSDYATFINNEQALRFQRNNDAHWTSIAVVVSYVLFSLILTGLLAYLGRRQLTALSDSYGAALDEQTAHAAVLLEQSWLRNAKAELAAELVGQLGAQELGRKALGFFARQLGSTVGALYVREPQGRLRRAASYGFSAEAEATSQTFSSAESLVGQAATGNATMLIEPVTSDYLKVNSGLGEMAPRAALLLPVTNEGLVNGVIELGLMGRPDARASELLDSVAGTIGMAVAAARYREQLQDVLAETQQLNEELQVQQEELRTANEELEEQSRVLRQSQATLENQQAELEQTNSQLSERTEA